jgi:hypothetical protein
LQLGVPALVGLALGLAPGLVTVSRTPDTRLAIYTAAGNWLRQMTPAAATVGTLEVGIIGYYSGRSMVDFAGLIQPEVAQQLSPTSSYEVSATWAINTYHPDYVVLSPDWFPGLMQAVVLPHCQVATSLAGAGYGYLGQLDIYACAW